MWWLNKLSWKIKFSDSIKTFFLVQGTFFFVSLSLKSHSTHSILRCLPTIQLKLPLSLNKVFSLAVLLRLTVRSFLSFHFDCGVLRDGDGGGVSGCFGRLRRIKKILKSLKGGKIFKDEKLPRLYNRDLSNRSCNGIGSCWCKTEIGLQGKRFREIYSIRKKKFKEIFW
jgi:hypothetical protein